MSEKVIGYLLIIAGICMMVLATISVYLVFTKQATPVILFNLPAPEIDLAKLLPAGMPLGTQTKQQLISSEYVNAPLNLMSHLFLMGFLVNIGFKVASLGIALVRPIVVRMREKKAIDE